MLVPLIRKIDLPIAHKFSIVSSKYFGSGVLCCLYKTPHIVLDLFNR